MWIANPGLMPLPRPIGITDPDRYGGGGGWDPEDDDDDEDRPPLWAILFIMILIIGALVTATIFAV